MKGQKVRKLSFVTVLVMLSMVFVLSSAMAGSKAACTKCGFETVELSKFCSKCGAAMFSGDDYYVGHASFGEINEVDGDLVVINKGSKDGVNVGDLFKTVIMGLFIKDRISGEILDREFDDAVKFKITKTMTHVSYAEFKTIDDLKPKPGDKIYHLEQCEMEQKLTVLFDSFMILPLSDDLQSSLLTDRDQFEPSPFLSLAVYKHYSKRFSFGPYILYSPKMRLMGIENNTYFSGELWQAGINSKLSIAKSYRSSFDLIAGVGFSGVELGYSDLPAILTDQGVSYATEFSAAYEKQSAFVKLGGSVFLRLNERLGLNLTVDYTFDLGEEFDVVGTFEDVGHTQHDDWTLTDTVDLKLNTVRVGLGLSYDFWTTPGW